MTLLDFTWLYLNIHRMIHFIYVSLSAAARNFSVSGNLHSVSKFIFYCAVLYYTLPCFSLHMLFFTQHTSLPCFSLHNTLHFTYVKFSAATWKVSFAEYHLFYMAFLQKRLIIWRTHNVLYLRETLSSHEKFLSLGKLVFNLGDLCDMTFLNMRDMTHSHVWHDPSICVTWPIHMCEWLFYMCDINHAYVWHDSAMCVTRRILYLHVWHDSFICVTKLVHMCDITHPYMWQDSFICVTWIIHIYVTWLIHVCDMTHVYM